MTGDIRYIRSINKISLRTLIILLFGFPCAFNSFSQTIPEHFIHVKGISEKLEAPHRIAVSPSGSLYIIDAFSKSLIKYDEDGNFIGQLSFGTENFTNKSVTASNLLAVSAILSYDSSNTELNVLKPNDCKCFK